MPVEPAVLAPPARQSDGAESENIRGCISGAGGQEGSAAAETPSPRGVGAAVAWRGQSSSFLSGSSPGLLSLPVAWHGAAPEWERGAWGCGVRGQPHGSPCPGIFWFEIVGAQPQPKQS